MELRSFEDQQALLTTEPSLKPLHYHGYYSIVEGTKNLIIASGDISHPPPLTGLEAWPSGGRQDGAISTKTLANPTGRD